MKCQMIYGKCPPSSQPGNTRGPNQTLTLQARGTARIIHWAIIHPTEYQRPMPIYEFECQKCKAHTEVFQKMSDKAPTKCDKCGGRLEKLVSASAHTVQGSGWYVTITGTVRKRREGESEAEAPAIRATAIRRLKDADRNERSSPQENFRKSFITKVSLVIEASLT